MFTNASVCDQECQNIPIYNFCSLFSKLNNEVIAILLKEYLQIHQRIIFPHRHNFYQILYITSGGGRHIIDFESFPIQEGYLFFLAPGQIHEWLLNKDTDGILINFNESFFNCIPINNQCLFAETFLLENKPYSAINLSSDKEEFEHLLNLILEEYNNKNTSWEEMIRALLIQLFVLIGRKKNYRITKHTTYQNYQLLKFKKLIEQFYTTKRLPKEYAELLFITPNYLNTLCMKITGCSAGFFIRNRILLEAKRLLANSTLTINEIAWQLNFNNNSYFTRFFKKYEGILPNEFRKKMNEN
jgi:AraC-like DNA-binding protein